MTTALNEHLISHVPGLAAPSATPSDLFGELSLSWREIERMLKGADAAGFRAFVLEGCPLGKELGNHVGQVVMQWAQGHGVTHLAHWFQPLTGLAAEKHDAFFSWTSGTDGELLPIEELRGSALLQGEPDASSFPSGGLRVTHEARGYTAWDPATPLFIREDGNARTLCLPCAYVSYTGHALDHKTPLLRANAALSRSASRFLNLVAGREAVTRVVSNLGTEQEYFLIDSQLFAQRPDLVMAGRTLIGNVPARHQQLEDHYFGVIPSRVQAYMVDMERELYRLGIPVKTRHCEVAPSQFELAPIFEAVTVACDHNVMTMEVLRRVAARHGLVCLLHEKPFAGVNGSGKHNNWSMSTDLGENLLEPGKTHTEQVRFVAVLAAVLLALHRHADVLRATVASAGNDHRLGANEAPPPIVSAYLGAFIDAVATAAENGELLVGTAAEQLALTDQLKVALDSTDRNRTAPFAFTGNKFEYRAVGSNENCAWPMAVLIAAVAESTQDLADRVEARLAGRDRTEVVLEVAREALIESRAVRFEGNGYAEAWRDEALRRGLPVLADTPDALAVLHNEAATGFLVSQGVLTREELASRYEIYAERYIKLLEIEGQTLAELATQRVLPAVERQLRQSADALRAYVECGATKDSHQRSRVRALADLSEDLQERAAALRAALTSLHGHAEAAGGLAHVKTRLLPAIEGLRGVCDLLETEVAEDLWPMPNYRDMLFPVA